MSQNLPVNGSKWDKNTYQFDEDFAKSYNGDSNKRHFLEVHVQHPEEFHELHDDLPFSSERMKIKKVEKVVANLHDKKEYVTHIRNSKQALNQGLDLKKVHRIIKFNQKAWLKPNIDMNTELRKKAKNDFEKDFFKLIYNSIFGKTMENVRKHGYIKLVKQKKEKTT